MGARNVIYLAFCDIVHNLQNIFVGQFFNLVSYMLFLMCNPSFLANACKYFVR